MLKYWNVSLRGWTNGLIITMKILVPLSTNKNNTAIILNNDFGLKRHFFLYLRLTNEQRAAVAVYFSVCKGSENSMKKVSLIGAALHPFLTKSYTDVSRVIFEEKLLCGQNLFAFKERD